MVPLLKWVLLPLMYPPRKLKCVLLSIHFLDSVMNKLENITEYKMLFTKVIKSEKQLVKRNVKKDDENYKTLFKKLIDTYTVS